jgi:hypothetical protein
MRLLWSKIRSGRRRHRIRAALHGDPRREPGMAAPSRNRFRQMQIAGRNMNRAGMQLALKLRRTRA